MGSIYKNAKRVVARVGPHQDQSDQALRTLSEFTGIEPAQDDPRERSIGRMQTNGLKRTFQYPGRYIDDYSKPWAAVLALCNGSYWTRVWVIREIALATDGAVVSLCGDLTMSMRDLAEGIQHWSFLHDKDAHRIAAVMLIHRARVCASQRRHLAYLLLEVARSGKAFMSLPHDYVYSLLPLAEDKASCGIYPDYTITVRELYMKVAVYLFSHLGDDLLRFCRLDFAIGPTVHLPSWVPNWAQLKSTGSVVLSCQCRGLNTRGRFSCGGSISSFSAALDGDTFMTAGFRLGSIDHFDNGSCEFKILHEEKPDGEVEPDSEEEDFDHDQIGRQEYMRQMICCAVADSFSISPDTHVPSHLASAIWMDDLVGDPCHKIIRPSRLSPVTAIDSLLEKFGHEMHIRAHELLESGFGFFWTESMEGIEGLGPSCMESGDIIFAIRGLDVPYVLRPTDGVKWLLVGQAYLYGAMDGEMVNDSTDWQELIIV
jgi:hypothetical protein